LIEDRRDVIIVASVSCIYSIGKKSDYLEHLLPLYAGKKVDRQQLLYKLLDLHYSRNDYEFSRGTFRVRGDVIDIIPAYEDNLAIRIELFGDEIDKLTFINPITGKHINQIESITITPAKLFVTSQSALSKAMVAIREELYNRLKELRSLDKLLEAQRLEQRTLFDLEMMREVGYCSGIENYSMHISSREFGDQPETLFNYFPDDFLLIVDESHVTVPQLRAMYNGDRARKTTLVEHGFRLPSALENRPLKFEEFESSLKQVVFLSATPGPYELEKCEGVIVEQVIRPTGLLDPEISVRPITNQIDDLIHEIRKRVVRTERILVTTLTKRMAEDLADYLGGLQIKVAYIHSDIDSLERVDIIRNLRLGSFDVLVGVNLLREGLDLPEVSLVAVLDADKEGFLRSERSLLQIAGRTARNVEGLVILYADKTTRSMQNLIDETNRRRTLQIEFNKINNINPQTVYKSLEEILSSTSVADIQSQRVKKQEEIETRRVMKAAEPVMKYLTDEQREDLIEQLFGEMKAAARQLDFERAAELRDEIQRLQAATGKKSKKKTG
jgi:excinuclease ABC subunit B